MMSFRRFAVTTASLALLVACATETETLHIPDNAIVYKIDPPSLRYEYVDTTAGRVYLLSWLPAYGFSGVNCIGLIPRTSVDTIGTFVFEAKGANTGRLLRTENGLQDTATAYFLPSNEAPLGTHGTYAIDSSNRLKLFWADGTPTRYFDPSADLRISGDTIRSYSDLRAFGDSLRVQWTVMWTYDIGC